MTPRHIGLWDHLTRTGLAGAWRTVSCALSSWGGFTHVVVHNGPLWRFCADCRGLRRDL